MNKIFTLLISMLIAFIFTNCIIAQDNPKVESKTQVKSKVMTKQKTKTKHGLGFVDANGDGYNDNAPDHDGDGIPNGLDEDYQGRGKKVFVDEDGDGINDNAGMSRSNRKGNRAKFSNRSTNMNGQSGGIQTGGGQSAGNKGRSKKGKR